MSISFSGEEGHHGTPLSDAADAARYAPVGRYAMSIGLCDRRRAVSPSPERCSYTRCCCSASCDNQTKCTLKRGSQPQSERGGRSFRTPSGVGDGSNQASRTVSCPGRLRGNSLAMRSRLCSVSRGIGRHRAHMRSPAAVQYSVQPHAAHGSCGWCSRPSPQGSPPGPPGCPVPAVGHRALAGQGDQCPSRPSVAASSGGAA